VAVREFGEARAHQPRQRKTIQSRPTECITQLRVKAGPGYTPRPLLEALPRLTSQFQTGWQADAHELIVFLLDKIDQRGPAGSILRDHANDTDMLRLRLPA